MNEGKIEICGGANGDVSPFIFGGLTEHFSRGLYGGLWDENLPGPRPSVTPLVREGNYGMLRWPGGCFADSYHWRDGIGPIDQRPRQDRQFWTDFEFGKVAPESHREVFSRPTATIERLGPPENNVVGTDEFLSYCETLGVEPMVVANFGTADPSEAADWVRYANRERSGQPVRWWGIGNENYGPWELGHCSAAEYGRRYLEFAEAMRAVDREIKLVAVGVAGAGGRYPVSWNREVLEAAGETIDALSIHWYFPGPWLNRELRNDETDYLALVAGADVLGQTFDQTLEEIDGVDGLQPGLPISLDEWNLWTRLEDLFSANARLCDGVFFAGCYNRMIERADRVKFALFGHLVNAMGPIQTEGDRAFGTSSHLVTSLYAGLRRRHSLPLRVECGSFDVPAFPDQAVPQSEVTPVLTHAPLLGQRTAALIDASATGDEAGTSVFLTNRGFDEPATVSISGLPAEGEGRIIRLTGPGPFATNDADHPNRLRLTEEPISVGGDGALSLELDPHGVAALSVESPA